MRSYKKTERAKGENKKSIVLYLIVTCLCLIAAILFVAVSKVPYTRILPYIVPHKNVLGSKTRITLTNTAFTGIYYGAGVDMSQLLPSSPRYVKNSNGEDLIDLAARLGINMFRITNMKPPYTDKEAVYSKEEWDTVLNKMHNRGIKAIILIESPAIYQKYITDSYLPFVKKYIIEPNVLSHPAVFGVDLYNEVVINSDDNLSKLKKASRMIKAKYPQARLTLGWWAVDTFTKDQNGNPIYKWNDYAAGRNINNIVDFYSLHMYGFDKQVFGLYPDPYLYTKNFITEVENGLQTNKPILIEEFGAANGDAVSDQETLGSKELQANIYAGVYQAIIDMKDSRLIGTTAYQYNTRENRPDAWAIIKNNGDYLYPASYVLQLFSTGTTESPYPLTFTDIPNDYLLTNADNNTTKTVNSNDIIGLSLTLSAQNKYTLTTSGDAALFQTENLINYWGQNKYYAVYHALKAGTETIVVKQGDKAVFTVTIVVK